MKDNLPRWDLSDLYYDIKDPSLEKDIQEIGDSIREFRTKYKGKVAFLSLKEFLKAIEEFEDVQEKMEKLQAYAYLIFSTNAQNKEIISFYQTLEERITMLSSDLLFFTLEINGLEEEGLQKKLENIQNPYKPWINILRLFRNHELSHDLEKVFLELSIPASQTWIRLFDETLGSLKIFFEGKELSLSDALNIFSSSRREERKAVAYHLSQALEEKGGLLALVYNTLMKEKSIEDRWRNYPHPQMHRHLCNQIEEETVEALSTAVNDAYPRLSHRYYALKAKVLGLEKLEYWDRNAPLFESKDISYTWKEAQELVLESYQDFSPKMAEIGQKFFDCSWIDAALYPGKDSGAYSHPTVPKVHPYILMNFYGKSRDVMTLAHELGHGIHQVLAAEQGHFLSNTPLTVAETASVFGEMLTFQRMLKGLEDPLQKKHLLSQKIEDMLNTVVRQIAFYTFEKEVHQRRQSKELSLNEFGEIWLKTQEDALGPTFHLDKSYHIYWTYISHFIHSPFYVYAYAVGDCLVNALYKVYENSSIHDFSQKYIELLRAGGSKPYRELLKPFHLDPHNSSFWNLGLSYIEGLISEFESLLDEG